MSDKFLKPEKFLISEDYCYSSDKESYHKISELIEVLDSIKSINGEDTQVFIRSNCIYGIRYREESEKERNKRLAITKRQLIEKEKSKRLMLEKIKIIDDEIEKLLA